MTEDRAEYTEVISSAVTCADHGLLIQLVSNAKTRREVIERSRHVEVAADAVNARHQYLTGRNVDIPAVAGRR